MDREVGYSLISIAFDLDLDRAQMLRKYEIEFISGHYLPPFARRGPRISSRDDFRGGDGSAGSTMNFAR